MQCVNGHNRGRYWKVGPQQSLFAAAPWLKTGANEVIALDLEEGRARSITGVKDPIYEALA
jgi:beta-galactosidase